MRLRLARDMMHDHPFGPLYPRARDDWKRRSYINAHAVLVAPFLRGRHESPNRHGPHASVPMNWHDPHVARTRPGPRTHDYSDESHAPIVVP